MADKIRVVHYLNQFFAQFGGEEIADIAPGFKDGPIGPGRALQQALGQEGEVVATCFCGDNCFAKWRVSNPNCSSRDLPSKAGATASLAAPLATQPKSG